jgi:hypothetical protein
MTLRTGSAPTSGPRSWRTLWLAGALVRSGDASVGPWTPPSRRSLAEEAGRDHGCRQANEAVLPFRPA